MRYQLRRGEALAISPDAIHRDADGFFLMLGPEAPPNERMGTAVVVRIRGALKHFDDGNGDSYEAITKRVSEAMKEPGATAVVLSIESPGGVVSGLNETVATLRKMSADAEIPLYAFVDEYAASAAYALCCACVEIIGPASAIVGSVGVISTMVSVQKQDEMAGIEFRLITSGDRKADGHLHGPITDEAVVAERARNAELAKQFFAFASAARKMTPKKLESLQAGIFLMQTEDTPSAVDVGLADDVMSWDEVCQSLGVSASTQQLGNAGEWGGNETDRRVKEKSLDTSDSAESGLAQAQDGTTPSEENMGLKLTAMVAALAAEADAAKRAAIKGQIDSYLVKRGAASGDEDDSDDEDDDENDEDSKSAKAKAEAEKAARKAEAAKHMAKAKAKRAEAKAKHAEAAQHEEDAKKCMEEDEDDEESSESEARATASADATVERARLDARNDARITQLEKERDDAKRTELIERGLRERRFLPFKAKDLAKRPLAYVEQFYEDSPAGLVSTDAEALLPGGTGLPPSELPKAVIAECEETARTMAATLGLDAKGTKEAEGKMLKDLLDQRRAKLATNGIAGRV